MNIAVVLSSNPISMTVKAILKTNGHLVTDTHEAELVIADKPRTLLSALKEEKSGVQFIAWPNTGGKVATGLLESEYADRVQIFAPSEDQRGTISWGDSFSNFLCSLKLTEMERSYS